MEMLKIIAILLVGFVVLVKSADIFVDAVSSIATNLKLSKMMIALTVAAFGTCAPELAISFQSISSGTGDIALANVLGSNIVNILLIVGLAACVHPIRVKRDVVKKELPILLIVTLAFVVSIVCHYTGITTNSVILDRTDGILFIICFVMFIFYIVQVIRTKQGFFEQEKPKYGIIKSIIITIICCGLIIISSDIVVDNAKLLAETLNISTKIITMTVVVIGTSLPEMTMTVVAAKKEEFDIALGNIIGTNIFNIGVVLGLPLLIHGGFSSLAFNLIDVAVVFIAAFILYIFARNDKILSKFEGAIMITIFVLYYTYIMVI